MLTMLMASDALAGFKKTESIVDGSRRLGGIRLGLGGSGAFISVREKDGLVICDNGEDIIGVADSSVDEVANRLLSELDRMYTFEMVLSVARSSNSLMAVMDAGSSMLDATVLVVDSKSMMCAMSSSADLDDDDFEPMPFEPDLKEIKYARLNGRLPWNALDFMDHEMVFASRLLASQGRPFAAEVFDRRAEAVVCRVESKDGGFSGFLFAFIPAREATGGKLQLVEMVAESVRAWIDAHEGDQRIFSKIDLLARLAGGEDVSDAEIAEGQRQMGGMHEFVLARVLHSSETSHAWMASQIQEGVEGSRCFEFRDVLFALCPGRDDIVDDLDRLAREHDIRFGLSWRFVDWRVIAEAVGQTDIALSYTPDKVAVLDSHCMMFYIFTQITSSMGGVEIMHPALETLYAHDSNHATEYARTLWVYLRRERNLVCASEDLGIHRNSLIYRIKRIEEMIPDVNLDDPEVREHLMMSYRIRGLRDRFDESTSNAG